MKCTTIQRIVLEHDAKELADEIISHLETCTVCGAFYRRAHACRQVIALKRYEIPSELRREACMAELHNRLVTLQAQRDQAGYAPHPAFRYAMAAAVVAMVAAYIATMNATPTLRSPVTQSDFHLRTFEQFVNDQEIFPKGLRLFETVPTTPTNAPPEDSFHRSIYFIGD